VPATAAQAINGMPGTTIEQPAGTAPVVNPESAAAKINEPSQQLESWYSGFKDENMRGYIENKGWKTAEDAIGAHRQLEGIFGADKAGKTLVIPDADTDPKAVAEFYTKLGVPTSAADYKLPVPEGQEEGFANMASQWMLDAKIPAEAGRALTEKFNEYANSQAIATEQQWQNTSIKEMQEVRNEWGKDFDRNIELGRRAARGFGLSDTEVEAFDRAVGSKRMVTLLKNIGEGLGEHSFQQGTPSPFGMSIEGAKAKLNELKSNKEWASKYLNGDAATTAEWNRLNRIAAGNAA
jgi:hypothetical protein